MEALAILKEETRAYKAQSYVEARAPGRQKSGAGPACSNR